MPEEQLTGVEEQVPAAGEQQETEEEDIFGFEEESGEEDPDAAGQEEAEEEGFQEEVTEKAFAARLKKEREKIAQETEERLRREYEAKYTRQQPQQQTGQQQVQQSQSPRPTAPPPLPREQLDSLADQLGVTTETAYAMYVQQWNIENTKQDNAQLKQYLQQMQQQQQDERTKGEAKTAIEQRRKSNPSLPGFDDTRLQQIRSEFQKKHGYALPWEAAYNQYVAEEVLSGNLTRTAQQKVINDITSRSKKTVQAGKGGQAKRPSIEDMSKEEFDALVEQAKAGKFKRS